MRQKNAILFGAALAAIPVASQAAMITYSYLPTTIKFSTTANGTYTSTLTGCSVTGTGAAEVVTIPIGDYVSFGMGASVTNNGGAGLYGFNIGISDSSSAAQLNTSSPLITTPLPAPGFSGTFGTKGNGQSDGAGGVLATLTGAMGASFNAAVGASYAQGVAFANGTVGTLFSKEVVLAKSGGTSVFTPIQVNTGMGLLTQTAAQAGLTSNQKTTANGTKPATAPYGARGWTGTDTIGAMPTLTINVTGGAATTTTASGHPIIALTNGAPTIYGSQLGHAITITGGNGSYNSGNTGLNTSSGVATGFTAVSAFTPANDVEVYALKLAVNNGAPLTTAQINAIISDINNGSGAGTAGVNVSAGTITGAYASLFPSSAGWDVLLTSTGGFTLGTGNSTAYLDFDFTQDTTTAGVTVAEVAAVPEPATLAGAVLGAAGLLLGRRKARAVA